MGGGFLRIFMVSVPELFNVVSGNAGFGNFVISNSFDFVKEVFSIAGVVGLAISRGIFNRPQRWKNSLKWVVIAIVTVKVLDKNNRVNTITVGG